MGAVQSGDKKSLYDYSQWRLRDVKVRHCRVRGVGNGVQWYQCVRGTVSCALVTSHTWPGCAVACPNAAMPQQARIRVNNSGVAPDDSLAVFMTRKQFWEVRTAPSCPLPPCHTHRPRVRAASKRGHARALTPA